MTCALDEALIRAPAAALFSMNKAPQWLQPSRTFLGPKSQLSAAGFPRARHLARLQIRPDFSENATAARPPSARRPHDLEIVYSGATEPAILASHTWEQLYPPRQRPSHSQVVQRT